MPGFLPALPLIAAARAGPEGRRSFAVGALGEEEEEEEEEEAVRSHRDGQSAQAAPRKRVRYMIHSSEALSAPAGEQLLRSFTGSFQL